ncbi:MFS transporter [Parasphingorhabdus pacifica]
MPTGTVSDSPETGTVAGRESRFKAWNLTGLLVLLYVINWGDKAVLGLVAQPLAEEIGVSATQIGLVSSAFFLAFTLGGLGAGLLNRYMAIKWTLVLLSLGWALAMLPVVFAATFGVLLISRMMLGATEGPASAIIHTGTYSWHPKEKRGLPSACITAAASIAKIAVAPALALVVAAWGWRAAFIVLAVVGIAWCAIWLLFWEEGPYGEQNSKKAATDESTDRNLIPSVPWGRIFVMPSFLGGAAATFAMYGLVTVVLTWLPSYFEVGLGYSRVQAGTMFGFPSIASLVLLFVLTTVSDRMISRGATSRTLRGVLPASGLLICGIALSTLPYISVPVVAVVVVSVGYAFGASIFPLLNSAISEIVPPQQLAGTLGVFLAITSAGGLVAPYVTGVIVDSAVTPAAGYASAFQVFGLVAVVGALLALFAVNPERDAAKLKGTNAAV